MTKKMKKRLYRILTGMGLFVVGLLCDHIFHLSDNILLVIFLAAYFVAGGDVVQKAAGNIRNGQVMDENFLMTLATVGAFFVGEYPEAVAVMLFYQVGELFQSYAVNRSRESISDLMDIYPEYANVKAGDEIKTVSPEEVQVGDILVLHAGDRIPLDGTVVKGSSTVDTKALTGEPVPKDVAEGDTLISGCINLNGVLEMRADKAYEDSTVARILELVENQGDKKAKTEQFITRFARYYTPVVVICAVLLALIPSLVLPDHNWQDWLYRGLSFLVISCPCALVISVPLSFFGGLGGASRQGILVKGSNYLEAAANGQIAVFDKTGTLTMGTFQVENCRLAEGIEEKELLETAALCEGLSNHPIGQCILNDCERKYGLPDSADVTEGNEQAGYGITARYKGAAIAAGNRKLMDRLGVRIEPEEYAGTLVYVARDGRYMGTIYVADVVKKDAAEAIRQLKAAGVKKTVMLTGDQQFSGEKVAKEVGVDQVYAQLLPADKVDRMEQLMKERTGKGTVLYVGDGINDAPVLAGADVGFAMGAMGADAAIEAADIVIMKDEPVKVAQTIRIARRTMSIVWQNIIFAIGVKILVLILAALGIANMWMAVFADVGVAVIAICNAMRAMYVGKTV